jgi:FGGY family of carbohydrate kinases, N-terminal domain
VDKTWNVAARASVRIADDRGRTNRLFYGAKIFDILGVTPMTYLIAIDQGTPSTQAIVLDRRLDLVAVAQQELRQIYRAPGWVEHDPEEIWSAVIATGREERLGPSGLSVFARLSDL